MYLPKPVTAIPLIVIMIALLMPTLEKTRDLSYRLICAVNMSELGKAIMTCENDYNGVRTPSKWCDLLIEKTKASPKHFQCKDASIKGRSHYALNKNIEKLGTACSPDTVLLFETSEGWNKCGGPEMLTTENHQGAGCNVLFADGRVEFVHAKDIPKLKWTVDANK